MLLRKIYYRLPIHLRYIVRKFIYAPLDILNLLKANAQEMVPPKGDIFVGSGDFIAQGEHQLSLLLKFANLQPHHHVLDIGCGIGRTAVPLTKFLNADGSYEGFDVVKKGVDWCHKNINSKHSNFNFQHVSLHNDLYHKGELPATQFEFPFEDDTFDVVFLFSVFTHMQPSEIDHYLAEISRVLRPNGICLTTQFLYDDSEEEELEQRKDFTFPIVKDGYRLMDQNVRSANVAIGRELWNEMVGDKNLKTIKEVKGYWLDNQRKSASNSFQDIVVLEQKSKETFDR